VPGGMAGRHVPERTWVARRPARAPACGGWGRRRAGAGRPSAAARGATRRARAAGRSWGPSCAAWGGVRDSGASDGIDSLVHLALDARQDQLLQHVLEDPGGQDGPPGLEQPDHLVAVARVPQPAMKERGEVR